jgi:hypothetical protein
MVAVVPTQDIDFIVDEGVCALQLAGVFQSRLQGAGSNQAGLGTSL